MASRPWALRLGTLVVAAGVVAAGWLRRHPDRLGLAATSPALRRAAAAHGLGPPRPRPTVGDELARWDLDGRRGERVSITVAPAPISLDEHLSWLDEPDRASGAAEAVLHRRSAPRDIVVHVVAPGLGVEGAAELANRLAEAVDRDGA